MSKVNTDQINKELPDEEGTIIAIIGVMGELPESMKTLTKLAPLGQKYSKEDNYEN